MKIERVIIRGLRALKARDDLFMGPDGVLSAACLRGMNGSGKTTYLEALGALWAWFGDVVGSQGGPVPVKPILRDADLVAARFAGLPVGPPSMWVVWEREPASYPQFMLDEPLFAGGREGVTHWDGATLAAWEEAFAVAQFRADSLPNIVYVEAERKFIRALPLKAYRVPPPVPAFLRLVDEPSAGHPELMMKALKLARRDRWQLLVEEFGRLRPNLRLLEEFDARTQRPQFQLAHGPVLTSDLLSAGERSVLINLCTVLRWLSPGGIVLLDEPELHQHLSLMRGSIAVTQDIIERVFDGQLIVASHAPEVWDHFRASNAIVDLDT